nr:retrovirus-related Pol polyprotein from transposon TNT 1-94 [Tanacetum cinerariifolium]
MALMAFLDSKEFQQREFKGYGPKTSKCASEVIYNEVKESPNAPLVKELVSDDKLEKKTIFPSVTKIEFVRPKQPEKPVKYAKMYRPVNTAHLKTTVYSARPMSRFSKSAQSTVKRPYQQRITLTNKSFSQKVNTAKGKLYTARPRAVNTARLNSVVVNAVRENQIDAIKASTCWVWRLTKLNSASITLKKHNYVDARGRSRNMFYLSDFKEFDGGYVTFKGGAKGGKITGKGTLKIVKTACYVQNRVLIVKPHNKTPYELFRGITPALSFMSLFGCHVTILNTLDHLGKFDDGLFVGCSLNSKAFRVYNIRTRKVEENVHIRFLKNKPIIAGDGPKWLFDIDALTKSMNYVLVVVGINSNDFVGTKESIGTGHASRNASNDEPQPSSDAENKDDEGVSKESRIGDQERPSINTTSLNVNTHRPGINTTSLNVNTDRESTNTASPNVNTDGPGINTA